MDWLGTLGYRTEVDPSGAEAGIARAEAEVRAALARIDDLEATATARIDQRTLDRDINQVERKLRALEKRAQVEPDNAELARALKLERERLKDMQLQRKTLSLQTREMAEARREAANALALAKKRSHEEMKITAARRKATDAAYRDGVVLDKLRVKYAQLIAKEKELGSLRARRTMGPERTLQLDATRSEIDQVSHSIRQLGGDTDDLDVHLTDTNATFRSWVASLSNIRVHAGFMSLTIRQFAIAGASLGPIILNLVGAASALVGVVGEGLVGAIGLGGAAVAGFGMSLLGMIGALTGADKRFEEFGKRFDKLQKDFQGRTGAARDSFFDLMARGLERAKNIMPAFARATNGVGRALEAAGQEFLRAFSGPQMQNAIKSIMGSFANILPALGRAAGNLARALSNVFRAFGAELPRAANGLVAFTEDIVDATKNGEGLRSWADDMVTSLGKVTAFLGAAGETIWTFFTAGSDAGGSLLDDMTSGLQDATQWIQDHPEEIGRFFENAVDGARDLWNVLKPLAETFLNVAQAMQPITEGLLGVAEAFASVVSAVSGTGIGQMLLTGLGGLTALRLLGGMARTIPFVGAGMAKAGAAARGAVPPFLQFGRGAAAVSKSTASAGRSTAAFQKQMASSGSRLAPVTRGVSTLGRGVAGLGSTLARGAAGVTAFLGPWGLVASAALLGADALGLFGGQVDMAAQREAQFRQVAVQATASLREQVTAARNLKVSMGAAWEVLGRGGQPAIQATAQIRQEIDGITNASSDARRAGQDLVDTVIDDWGNWDDLVGWTNEDMQGLKQSIMETGRITGQWRERLKSLGVGAETIRGLNEQLGRGGQLIRRSNELTKEAALQTLNLKRAQQGMDRLPRSMASAYDKLVQSFGKQRATKMLLQVDDRQAAQKLTSLANQAARLGQKEHVLKIMASDRSAEAKLRALDRYVKGLTGKQNTIKLNATGNADDKARNTAKSVKSIPKRVTSQMTAKDATSAKAKAAESNLKALVRTFTSTITAQDNASGPIQGILGMLQSIVSQTWVARVVTSIAGAVGGGGRAMGGPLATGNVPGYATGGGFIRQPMFLVGEESPRFPEWVIATNPRYREDNLRYLYEAADAIGAPGFRRGGRHRGRNHGAGGGGRPGRRGRRGRRGQGQGGGGQGFDYSLDDTEAQEAFDRAKEKYQRSKDRLKRLEDKKNADPGSIQSAERQVKQAKKALDRAKKDLDAVKRFAGSVESLESQISLDQSEMDLASETGDSSSFATWQGEKIRDLDALIALLTQAANHTSGKAKFDIQDRIAQAQLDRAQTAGAALEADLLTPAEQAALDQIEMEGALAELTIPREDEIAANQKAIGFWESVLNRLQTTGAAPALVTEAAQNLLAAQQGLFGSSGAGGIGGGVGGIATQSDLFTAARKDLYAGFGSNVQWKDAAFFRGGSTPGGDSTSVHVENHFQEPPPDPHTWSEQQAYELQTMG